jgi:hypothetical protein
MAIENLHIGEIGFGGVARGRRGHLDDVGALYPRSVDRADWRDAVKQLLRFVDAHFLVVGFSAMFFNATATGAWKALCGWCGFD